MACREEPESSGAARPQPARGSWVGTVLPIDAAGSRLCPRGDSGFSWKRAQSGQTTWSRSHSQGAAEQGLTPRSVFSPCLPGSRLSVTGQPMGSRARTGTRSSHTGPQGACQPGRLAAPFSREGVGESGDRACWHRLAQPCCPRCSLQAGPLQRLGGGVLASPGRRLPRGCGVSSTRATAAVEQIPGLGPGSPALSQDGAARHRLWGAAGGPNPGPALPCKVGVAALTGAPLLSRRHCTESHSTCPRVGIFVLCRYVACIQKRTHQDLYPKNLCHVLPPGNAT